MQSLLQHFDTIGSTLDIDGQAQFARVACSPRRHSGAVPRHRVRRRLGGVVPLPVKVNPSCFEVWLKSKSQPPAVSKYRRSFNISTRDFRHEYSSTKFS